MSYEINIALNGSHFFATDKRSITTKITLNKIYKVLKQKFPESEGYELSVTEWNTIGAHINMEKEVIPVKDYLSRYFGLNFTDEALSSIVSSDDLYAAMDVESLIGIKSLYTKNDVLKSNKILDDYAEGKSLDDRLTFVIENCEIISANYWVYAEDDFDVENIDFKYVIVKLLNGTIYYAQIPEEI